MKKSAAGYTPSQEAMSALHETIGVPGQAPKPVREPTKRGAKTAKPRALGVDNAEIERIKKILKKEYAHQRDFQSDPATRIIDAIQYLRTKYPGMLIPLYMLYWMTNPEKNFLSSTSAEVLAFAQRVSRCKPKMSAKYNISFFITGGSKNSAGFVRAFEDGREQAKYNGRRVERRIVGAVTAAQQHQANVGTVEKLAVNATFTADDKEAARKLNALIANVKHVCAGYLPEHASKTKAEPVKR